MTQSRNYDDAATAVQSETVATYTLEEVGYMFVVFPLLTVVLNPDSMHQIKNNHQEEEEEEEH